MCGSIKDYRSQHLKKGGSRLSCGCIRWTHKRADIPLLNKRRYLTNQGYVVVAHRGKTLRLHRLIYEEHLGRPLQPWEHIHHRNGIRTDNRLENLELIHAGKHFAGQRPADIVKAKTDAEKQRLIADGMALLAAAGYDLSHLNPCLSQPAPPTTPTPS